jgi:DNA-binding FadR family transcriptional regulator
VTLTQLFEFRSNIEAMAFESAVHKAKDTDIKILKKKSTKLEKAYRKNILDNHQPEPLDDKVINELERLKKEGEKEILAKKEKG